MLIRRLVASIGISSLVLTVILATANHNASTAAKASQGCGDAALQGTYSGAFTTLAYQLKNPPRNPKPIGDFIPSSINGLVAFDGQGHFSATGTSNFGGTYGRFNFHGGYVVNSDCTGRLRGGGLVYDFTVHQDGSVMNGIQAEDGTVAAFTLTRMDQ